MGLFNLKKKKEKNTLLVRNEETYSEWYVDHSSEMKMWEDKIVDLAIASQKGTIDEKISTLKKLIDLYEEYREYCYSKGVHYQKHFQDLWEHCHNSRNPDFDYIEPHIKEYNELIANRDAIYEEEQRKVVNMQSLDERVMNVIKEEDGILQRDLYKKFDPSVKSEISEILYFWAKDGVINREKAGNTYKLSYIGEKNELG